MLCVRCASATTPEKVWLAKVRSYRRIVCFLLTDDTLLYDTCTSYVYAQYYSDNDVDGDALMLLTDDMIKQLIPSLGLRSKFLAKWKKFQITMCSTPVSKGTCMIKNQRNLTRSHMALTLSGKIW